MAHRARNTFVSQKIWVKHTNFVMGGNFYPQHILKITTSKPVSGYKPTHNAFEWASFRVLLRSLFRQLAWLKGYDLRQSTSTQLIPSFPADRPGTRSDQPCPALPLLFDIADHCRPTIDTTTITTTTTQINRLGKLNATQKPQPSTRHRFEKIKKNCQNSAKK